MENPSLIYPRNDDGWPSNQESPAETPQTARSAIDSFPRPSPSHPGASADLSVGATSQHLIHQSTQLYSPTKAEIEAHPIRKRLSDIRDHTVTDLGTAPEDPHQAFFGSNNSSSRQAQEGSERLFDAMSDSNDVKEGDQVSYQWSGSAPGGTVTDVATKDGKGAVTMETKRGNEVKKNAEPGNPALYIERSGHDVVKQASEVEVEKSGDSHKEAPGEKKTVGDKKENGNAQTGDKRSAEETSEEKKDEEEGDAKKQKTDDGSKANGEQPKKKGRPAKKDTNGKAAPKKDTKKRQPKKAATETGEPRRSGRNAGK